MLCISRLHFQTFTRQCARRCCHRRLKTATIEAIWNDFNQNWTRQKRFIKRSKHSSHLKIICHSRIWKQGTMVTAKNNSGLFYRSFLSPILQLTVPLCNCQSLSILSFDLDKQLTDKSLGLGLGYGTSYSCGPNHLKIGPFDFKWFWTKWRPFVQMFKALKYGYLPPFSGFKICN